MFNHLINIKMHTKIKNFLSDKFNSDINFIGDIHENGEKINFNVQIKDADIDIPVSCQVLNIDASLGLGPYIKFQINKSELLNY
jgi:hypothetical protein